MEEKFLKEFLETTPPNSNCYLLGPLDLQNNSYQFDIPELNLFCENEKCRGMRIFETPNDAKHYFNPKFKKDAFLYFRCKNCKEGFKRFSLQFQFDNERSKWKVRKFGEDPDFGSSMPSKIFNLIGGERDLFLMGKRSEHQGMGIGAFVYYRRVIESQKGRIFDEIIRVVKQISPGNEVISDLENAKKEVQFTKAIDSIKHALPESLFINGYNPLTLLHSALSEGVHEHNDTECLELASDIRTVLIEFSERLGSALKEEAALNKAVNRLANKSKK